MLNAFEEFEQSLLRKHSKDRETPKQETRRRRRESIRRLELHVRQLISPAESDYLPPLLERQSESRAMLV